MIKVFISHSTKDFQLVERLAKFLKSCGIEAYLAERDYKIGRSVSQKIMQNIDTSDYFLIVYTKNGKESTFVHQEIGYWKDKKRDIDLIPFVEKGLSPSGLLSGVEYIEFNPLNPNLGIVNVERYITQTTKKKRKQAIYGTIAGLGIIGLAVLVVLGLSKSGEE